jgi:hypothetical protein
MPPVFAGNMFVDFDTDGYRLIRFDPETAVARDQSYSSPADAPENWCRPHRDG